MIPFNQYLERKRQEAWSFGIQHREHLVRVHMARHGLGDRPLLKEIIDHLIEEVQGVRLREGILPLDTFAQTEAINGRLEITVNRRIGTAWSKRRWRCGERREVA